MSGILSISKTVVANYYTGVDVTTPSDSHTVHDDYIVPDNRPVSNGDVPIQCTVMADADILSQLDLRRNIGKLSDGGALPLLAVKMLDSGKERPLAFSSADKIGSGPGVYFFGNERQSDAAEIEPLRNVCLFFNLGEGAGLVMGQRGKLFYLFYPISGKRKGNTFAFQIFQDFRNFHRRSSSARMDGRSKMFSAIWR